MQISPASLISTDANYTPGSARAPIRTLNQDDFLKLVMAQLTHQDPLKPQSDAEFIAQMAQFSALEQAKSMQTDISALRSEQQLLQANALLGRSVKLLDEQGGIITGNVSAIQVESGIPQLVVNNRPYDLTALLSIEPSATTSATP
jgi:flagellar basal-body rod modification protein FlgD